MATRETLECRVRDCQQVADFARLAREALTEPADPDYARSLYAGAARLVDSVPATISYANGYLDLFDDPAAARAILDDAETDCQVTKDFVQLAAGYRHLFADTAKARELLNRGADFARGGEEHLQVAEGYWKILQDRTAAAVAYGKALADTGATEALLTLGKAIASEIEDRELAGRAYAKAEAKLNTVKEVLRLARAVARDVGDRTLLNGIYARAEARFTAPADMAALAPGILADLGDSARAASLYRRALDRTGDFAGAMKLLEALPEGAAPALLRAGVDRLAETAGTTAELLQLAERAGALLGDDALTGAILTGAAERVTTLDELRQVVAAARTRLPADAERLQGLAEKLARREADQVRHAELQALEKKLQTLWQRLALVDRVMAELDDPRYARTLLLAAEQKLEESAFDISAYGALIRSVDRHLHDAQWVQRLACGCAAKSANLTTLRRLCQALVTELADRDEGRALASTLYQQAAEALRAEPGASAYEYVRLATALLEDLDARDWALAILADADRQSGDYLAHAAIGHALARAGDADGARAQFRRAAEAAADANHYRILLQRLRAVRSDAGAVREAYAIGGDRLRDPRERLRWAEGIVDLLGDREWATRIYDELTGVMTNETDRAALAASRRLHLGHRLR